jgi:hypothetical protein
MKNKKIWVKTGLTIAIGLVILMAGILYPFRLEFKSPSDPKKIDQSKKGEAVQIMLTKWVYDNSTRISRATCKEIVCEVMKTKYPVFMLSIVELESVKFTPGSLSSAGAIGWCQIMYEAHGAELMRAGIIKEKRDLWDTGPNIRAGAFIFEKYLNKNKGDVAKTLENYLGKKDGAYLLRILSTHANLSILVQD